MSVAILAWSNVRVRDMYLDREQTKYRGRTSHRLETKLGGLRPIEETSLLRRYFKFGKRHEPIAFGAVMAMGVLFVVATIGLAISVL